MQVTLASNIHPNVDLWYFEKQKIIILNSEKYDNFKLVSKNLTVSFKSKYKIIENFYPLHTIAFLPFEKISICMVKMLNKWKFSF